MAAFLLIELSNVLPAIVNSTGWLFGKKQKKNTWHPVKPFTDFWEFTFNVLFMMFSVALGGIVCAYYRNRLQICATQLFVSMYIYNRYTFRNLSITIAHYSVTKTLQIRENRRIMEVSRHKSRDKKASTFSVWCSPEYRSELSLLLGSRSFATMNGHRSSGNYRDTSLSHYLICL